MTTNSTIEEILPAFIAALDAMTEDYFKTELPGSHERGLTPKHRAEIGKKYIRIVQFHRDSGSAFCFLDADGNILKADGWKRPAKGIRGNILNDPNYSIGKGLTRHGAAYAR